MATATLTPKYQPVLNLEASEAIKVVFAAADKVKALKASLREGITAYNQTLSVLGSVYLASDLAKADGMSAKSIAALAGRDDEQQTRYYLRNGWIQARLVNDGKTAPAAIQTQINKVAQQGNGLTLSRVDEIIKDLVDKGGSWADFVSAVKAETDKVNAKVERALNALEDADSLDAGQLARLQLLVSKHTK
jgi:hypothetical protein